MRIIGGFWRSRRLLMPQTASTRPMPDRVKAAIFSMLGSHFGLPGLVPPFSAVDLFAGSGSMGLEALSRGAKYCKFVETGPVAVEALRANLTALGAESRARVIVANAWEAPSMLTDETLVFLDPPYSDSLDWSDGAPLPTLLRGIAQVARGTAVGVLHFPAQIDPWLDPAGPVRVIDRRTYGSNGIMIVAL